MKKSMLTLLVTLLLLSLALTSCQSLLKGTGDLTTETYNYTGFSRVVIDGPFTVTLSQGDDYGVEITADKNVFQNLETSVKDGVLILKLKSSSWFGISRTQYVDTTIKAIIQMPYVRGLSLNGAAKGVISGFDSRASLAMSVNGAAALDIMDISVGDTTLEVSGAGKMTGKVTAGDMNIRVKDASVLELQGDASNIICDISGASNLNLTELAVDNASV